MRRHEQFVKGGDKKKEKGKKLIFIQWSHLLIGTPRQEEWGRVRKTS